MAILVAEDDMISQKLVCKILEKIGITADVVSNGQLAVQAATQKKYDLIMLDFQMPVMNGIDAIREIRKTEKNKESTIVVVTAQAMKGDKESFIEAGFDGYISKPYTEEDIQKYF